MPTTKYKIKVPNENPKDAVISRTGREITFTLSDVEAHMERLEKLKEECKKTVELCKTKLENIEHHHPYVAALSEQEAFTVHMYQDIKNQMLPYMDKLDEVENQLKEYTEDIADIKKQLPELDK